jgi:Fuc2NAc and GlcNAc transferase
MLLLLTLCSGLGLWGYARLAPLWGLVDLPNARSLHEQPTVVGGGVIPVSVIIGCLALGGVASFSIAAEVSLLLAGLMAIGLADDRWGIPAAFRLVCYLAAGLALVGVVLPVTDAISPAQLLMMAVAGIGVAWCTNLFNFMDGVDGIAMVQLLSVACGLGLVAMFSPVGSPELVTLCSVLFAACLPFLWFNWPPAKLFMGDAGAIPLGFFLALLGLLAVRSSAMLACVWLILMMPFIVDTGLTLCVRTCAGKPPHLAHRDHAYQRLTIKMGGSLPVVLGLMGLQVIWQFPLAVTAVSSQLFPPLLVVLSAIPALMVVVYARASA